MSATDFEQWATPDLELTVGGRTFKVPPPTVEGAKQVIAAAARAEVNLGIVQGPLPDEVQAMLASIGPDDHPALGDAYAELVAAGLPAATIDRVGYYAVFYWARGKKYADSLATLLWTPRPEQPEEAPASPKAAGSSPPRTGRRTA